MLPSSEADRHSKRLHSYVLRGASCVSSEVSAAGFWTGVLTSPESPVVILLQVFQSTAFKYVIYRSVKNSQVCLCENVQNCQENFII